MNQTDFSILVFELSGKFAHFRKFYTNASSLSYFIPPRTVIAGLLASILEMPRDSYYEALAPDNCRISAAASTGTLIKKATHSVNMLHERYQGLMVNGTGKIDKISMHTQCKLELLSAPPGQRVTYRIYVAMKADDTLFTQLVDRIRTGNHGYGIYLGQRQFRADVEFIQLFNPDEITFIQESDVLDSLCPREHVLDLKEEDHLHVMMEQVPVQMRRQQQGKKKEVPGREPLAVKQVLFEKNGNRIKGRFKQCWKIVDTIIAFY